MAEPTQPKRVQDLFTAPQKQHQEASTRKPPLAAEALDKANEVILSEFTPETDGK